MIIICLCGADHDPTFQEKTELYSSKPCVRSTRLPAKIAKDSKAHFSRVYACRLPVPKKIFGTPKDSCLTHGD